MRAWWIILYCQWWSLCCLLYMNYGFGTFGGKFSVRVSLVTGGDKTWLCLVWVSWDSTSWHHVWAWSANQRPGCGWLANQRACGVWAGTRSSGVWTLARAESCPSPVPEFQSADGGPGVKTWRTELRLTLVSYYEQKVLCLLLLGKVFTIFNLEYASYV